MRLSGLIFVVSCVFAAASFIFAQPPVRPERGSNSSSSNDQKSFIDRMMTLDANHDGKLAKDEVKDTRLIALFERADTNQDGIVTAEELTVLYNKEASSLRNGGPGSPGFGPGGAGPGGPGGFGGPPGGFGPGGPDGPGGRGGFGPPRIGQVLPPPIQDMLQLTAEQKQKLDELQKQVDTSLAKILTAEQKQQLEEMRNRGPGGFGPGPDGPPSGGGRGRGRPPQ